MTSSLRGTGESNSALEFSQALFVNRKLLHLNLGHNRLNRHDLFLILRRVEQANNTCMVLHLEGNWHPGPDCKTHDGHARHQVILEDDPDAAEGRTGCAVFDRALAPRPPAVHGAVQFRGASLNAHASVHLEVDEATVHEDAGHDHAVHGFDSLLDPGTSMLFSRILGRSQMLHAMEWIECHRCWICAEASQFTFELDSLAEIGLTRVGGGWPDAEWWRAIELCIEAIGQLPARRGLRFIGGTLQGGEMALQWVTVEEQRYLGIGRQGNGIAHRQLNAQFRLGRVGNL